ncbi:MAG: hypothetical protein PQJ59_14470 [Spirochaetales bacterium]|nr:hypothetical protein [Spirochaetales bacterium]
MARLTLLEKHKNLGWDGAGAAVGLSAQMGFSRRLNPALSRRRAPEAHNRFNPSHKTTKRKSREEITNFHLYVLLTITYIFTYK